MSHRRSTVKGSLSFANPTVRAWLFQILAVVAVVGIVGWLFHNTVTNLNNRGITSGFAFLDRGAGFGIVQHLIDYQQGDTYGRVFIVGLLNTLLVSALCIVFASVLGFFIGLARLSDNWLLRKLSTIYIEIFRNIPPLLQIFFWYFAVLRNLPGPRQAVSAFDLAFLSNRGLYIPSPQLGDGFIAFILAVVMAIVLSVGLFRFNKTYQIKTGQLRRTWPIAAVLIIGLPLLAQWLFGAALHWDVPALRGFNFRGGMVLIPELAALTLALSVYTSAFIAEIIRAGIQAVPYGQHEAARSGITQPGYATPGHYSPGIAGDYSTVNQPVSQHRQKLLSCRRYWLSRYGFAVCRHRAESDGASHRDDSHDHVGLSDYQPDYLAADEYL